MNKSIISLFHSDRCVWSLKTAILKANSSSRGQQRQYLLKINPVRLLHRASRWKLYPLGKTLKWIQASRCMRLLILQSWRYSDLGLIKVANGPYCQSWKARISCSTKNCYKRRLIKPWKSFKKVKKLVKILKLTPS